MKHILLGLIALVGTISINTASAQPAPHLLIVQDTNFSILDQTIQPIEKNINTSITGKGARGIQDFIINTFYDVVFPIIFAVGLLMAILGAIGLLFSDKEEERVKLGKIVMWGLIGIVLITSARYLTFTILGQTGDGGVLFGERGSVSGIFVAQDLYDKIIVPFIDIGFMLMAGVLFVMLLIRALGFIANPGDESKKQSLAIIMRNALGILIIIGAKSVVELIYGKQESVINDDATKLSEIGQAIFSSDASAESISLFYAIINWVMGITSLVILIIIIWQAYQLLANPEDESRLSKVSKSLMYIFVGIIIIGLSYVISNAILVQ